MVTEAENHIHEQPACRRDCLIAGSALIRGTAAPYSMPLMTSAQHPIGRTGGSDYGMYGLVVRSQIPLAGLQKTRPGRPHIELVTAPASLRTPLVQRRHARSIADDWFHHAALDDGSTYLLWTRLSEFWVSPDGKRIACRAFNGTTQETFHTYLVPQVISCALVKQGIEPLHATAAVVDGEAVAFLGNCGYGKSCLGAAFLKAGYPLLTDDLLVTSKGDLLSSRLVAHPGPARIKLFPEIAQRLLGSSRAGARLNPETHKLILPLSNGEHCPRAIPLKALYVLRPPTTSRTSRRISIHTLSPRHACIELIANTFNLIITDQARLARQFRWASGLAATIPVKSLSYPRKLAQAGRLVETICKDLSQ